MYFLIMINYNNYYAQCTNLICFCNTSVAAIDSSVILRYFKNKFITIRQKRVYHKPQLYPDAQVVTCLTEVNSSRPHLPSSRPKPLFFTLSLFDLL